MARIMSRLPPHMELAGITFPSAIVWRDEHIPPLSLLIKSGSFQSNGRKVPHIPRPNRSPTFKPNKHRSPSPHRPCRAPRPPRPLPRERPRVHNGLRAYSPWGPEINVPVQSGFPGKSTGHRDYDCVYRAVTALFGS